MNLKNQIFSKNQLTLISDFKFQNQIETEISSLKLDLRLSCIFLFCSNVNGEDGQRYVGERNI